MQIELVDPRHDDAFAEWVAVVLAADACERPGEIDWTAQELRQLALHGLPGSGGPTRTRLLAVRDDVPGGEERGGGVVGAVRLDLPQRDNLDVAVVDLRVHPAHRRRGVGSRLLAAVDEELAADGRRTLVAEVDERPELVGRSPGRAFAIARGFRCALEEVRRDLACPPDAERLAALPDAAEGYRLHTWADRCPDGLVEQRVRLAHRMSVDVPMGELQIEEETWDVARLRHQEALHVAQERTVLTVAAEHEASGELVAYTELHISRPEPARAFQADTLVVGEHRGRRLGTVVKVHALRELVRRSPATRVLSTWNAVQNGPMVAVNDALGFVPNGLSTEWQRTVDA